MFVGLTLAGPRTAVAGDTESGDTESGDTGSGDGGGIDVVQISGLIDPPNVDLLLDTIESAEERDATMVVIQLDSHGALDVNVSEMLSRVSTAKVPIIVWIGPAGSSASSVGAALATSGSYLSMASNAKLGPTDQFALDDQGARPSVQLSPHTRMNAQEAIDAGFADSTDPTLRNLLTDIDGTTVKIPAGGKVTLRTKIIDPETGDPSVNQDVRFHKLGVDGQLLHTLNAPWVAYFLFVLGIGLIVFEFYAASIGAATIVGAGAVIGAFVGFSHLPVQPAALVLLALALFALTVDLQAGGVGVWTGVGVVLFVVSSLFLYDGSTVLDLAWWTIVLVGLGTLAFWVGGLPAMLRTRFSTPTIGREGIIGEMGTAEVDIAPEGVVRVRDALWRARVNRATPVTAGDAIRVVAVEGLMLEIEPESGGAQDYRERARRKT